MFNIYIYIHSLFIFNNLFMSYYLYILKFIPFLVNIIRLAEVFISELKFIKISSIWFITEIKLKILVRLCNVF